MNQQTTIIDHQPDWENVKQRFTAWWNHSYIDRPLMHIITPKKEIAKSPPPAKPEDPELLHTDITFQAQTTRHMLDTHTFLADAFPNTNINLGPGSMATYLGSEPVFMPDTIWYSEVVENWHDWDSLTYNPKAKWLLKHLDLIKHQKDNAGNEYLINIPDIIENVDILSAMRGPQKLCYDLIDQPELMKKLISQIDDLYFKYYDAFYDIIKADDGSSSYTAFQIWGMGKTAKIQCDFSALMNPDQFYDFVQPSLRKQCQHLDNTLYHLDGPGAIIHLDALMEIDELDALQWTAGAGQPTGGEECWYSIYDKVKAAGKSLWVSIQTETYKEAMQQTDKLVKRYGPDGLYLLFDIPDLNEQEGRKLVSYAEKHWN